MSTSSSSDELLPLNSGSDPPRPSAFETVFRHPTSGRPFLLTGVFDDEGFPEGPAILQLQYQDGSNELDTISQAAEGVTEYDESTSESSSLGM